MRKNGVNFVVAVTDELFDNPLHPYTKVLLSAVPIPDPAIEKERQRLLMDPDFDYTESSSEMIEVSPGHFLSASRAAELSIGQQQRVAAARALIGAPELLIADEPTSALDNDLRERFINLLLTECDAAESAVLFVSHDVSLGPMFDRQIALADINQAGQSHE